MSRKRLFGNKNVDKIKSTSAANPIKPKNFISW